MWNREAKPSAELGISLAGFVLPNDLFYKISQDLLAKMEIYVFICFMTFHVFHCAGQESPHLRTLCAAGL